MLHSRDEVAALLIGTPLEGLELAKSPVSRSEHDSIDILLEGKMDSSEAWQAARALVDQTGRWPLVLDGDPSSERGDSAIGDQILHAADAISERNLRHELRERWGSIYGGSAAEFPLFEKVLEYTLQATLHAVGSAPTAGDVIDAVGPGASMLEINRWLYEWERGKASLPGAEQWDSHVSSSSFAGNPNLIHLLPVAHGWQVPSLLDWFDYEYRERPGQTDLTEMLAPHALMAAALRSWEARFQAEVQEWSGVEMLFHVGSSPNTDEDIWDLIVEHEAVAGDWMFNSYRDYARSLVDSDRWYLFNKP